MAAPWTFSPIQSQPAVFEEITIYPGEGETLRLQKLSEFARKYWKIKSSQPQCRIEIAAHYDDANFKAEWANQRRNWVSRVLIAQERIPAQSIALNPPMNNSRRSGTIVVRMTTAKSVFETQQAQYPAHRGGVAATATDPRCRPIGGNFKPFRPRKLLVKLYARKVSPSLPPSWDFIEMVEIDLTENNDSQASIEKITAAFTAVEKKLAGKFKEDGYEIKLEGQTLVESEFDHNQSKQWHTDFSQKLNSSLSLRLRLGKGFEGTITLKGEIEDPEGLVRKGEFSGEVGVEFEFAWEPKPGKK